MTAFSPARLTDVPVDETFRPRLAAMPVSGGAGFIRRAYESLVAAWRPTPALSEMGPSQTQELLVMRGRD